MNPILEFVRRTGFHPLKLCHIFVYGRFPGLYARAVSNLMTRGPQTLKDDLVENYHGKVVRLDDARKIVSVNRLVDLRNLETVIPYKNARELILNGPDTIAAYECMCRSVRANPCKPSDVCLVIGEPFASGIVTVQPGKARKISREEAVGILEAEQERGHIHTAFFKDIMLNRFYAICNCCRCCCGAMKATLEYELPMIAPSGYVSSVSQDCNACGLCVDFCPFGAISLDGETAKVDPKRCFGCGLCQTRCRSAAVSLIKAPEKGEPLDIETLAANTHGGPTQAAPV
ncbi:MAG: 4Fe-4S binding protein [Chloroflexi bacterium]|nr:4Fe-4S binding protein [Chloroflexota bacterium]